MNFWVGTLTRRGIPLLVVQFEHLKEDTIFELQRMTQFLGVSLEDNELRKLGRGFAVQAETRHAKHFNSFCSEVNFY